MKVLLLKDVKGLGRRMDVKEVADGYGRNFLIARGLAAIADTSHLKEKTQYETEKKVHVEKLTHEQERLAKTALSFAVKSGKAGQVFGSVTAEMIEKKLVEKGFEDAKVVLKKPLKTTGKHQIEVDLGEGIKGVIEVTLTPGEQ